MLSSWNHNDVKRFGGIIDEHRAQHGRSRWVTLGKHSSSSRLIPIRFKRHVFMVAFVTYNKIAKTPVKLRWKHTKNGRSWPIGGPQETVQFARMNKLTNTSAFPCAANQSYMRAKLNCFIHRTARAMVACWGARALISRTGYIQRGNTGIAQ